MPRSSTQYAAGLALVLLCLAPTDSFSEPVTVGYRDFSFGDSVNSTPTGDKPESKLWWNDGTWWGSLWDVNSLRYEIHRFDPTTQSWTSTETPIDTRSKSKGDVLWDGQHLYVVSHLATVKSVPSIASGSGRLFRFSYDALSQTYTLDPGFPVRVNRSKTETLVLDKDSTGKLWITWVEDGKVKLNRTLGDDLTWGEAFDLPVQGPVATFDDISSIIAFGGNRIGVAWSNQAERNTCFAVHHDGDPDSVWDAMEIALAAPESGLAVSNDHLNLKTHEGVVYLAAKTSLAPSSPELPLIFVLERDVAGSWTQHLFGTAREDHTRPILLIDVERDSMYVVARSDDSDRGVIYMKSASLTNLVFEAGLGTPFIDSPADSELNNPTSTKQNLTSETGLLVLAGDEVTHFYLHNYVSKLRTSTGVADAPGRVLAFHAGQPNPFYRATRIRFQLQSAGKAQLAIYDISGRLIRELVRGDLQAGPHELVWDGRAEDGRSVWPGTYLARLVAGTDKVTQKLIRMW